VAGRGLARFSPFVASAAVLAAALALAGCTAAAPATFSYLALNDDCRCAVYRMTQEKVAYGFSAVYNMHDGLTTSIQIELVNGSRDTLSLDVASMRVSSRNITYQYNNKFVPLPSMTINPGGRETLHLTGKDIDPADDWHKIAGERLVLTIKGVRLGHRELPLIAVTFVPSNPRLGE
jgi:hypothetical protein